MTQKRKRLSGPKKIAIVRRYLVERVPTTGSEKTAGRSRGTSNRRFASGRRPGCESPREVLP
jgi:hypothetical protein